MAAIMYNPTMQDNIDITNEVFPNGYNIIANRVAKIIKLYGW